MAAVAYNAKNDLASLLDDFADDVGRHPTSRELAEVFTLSIPAAEVFSVDPGGATIEVAGRGQAGSAVAELNDSVFSNATELLIAVARHLHGRDGSAPRLHRTLDEIAATLYELGEDGLADHSASMIRFTVRRARKRQARPTAGDVVAIPVGEDSWAFAIVVAQNRFGLAVGLLRHRGPLGLPPATVEVDPLPLYTDDSAVREGRWKVVGRHPSLLDRFPVAPEIYHRPWPDQPDPALGPHGAGETPDGTLRRLSEAEAQAIGLADNTYQQTMFPATVEANLAAR